MSDDGIILVNMMKVEPDKQEALLALLQANIDEVIRTLPGWRATRLIASGDGAGIVIYSEWDSAASIAGMRADPRMQAYFPRIAELASFETMMGAAVLEKSNG